MKGLLERIDHIGIAVFDIDKALELYRDRMGMVPGLRRKVEAQQVEVQFLELPGTKIELLAPLSDDSPISRFLAKRGEGLHHITYAVPDVARALAQLTAGGIEAIDKVPRPGAEGKAVAFLHPRSTGGVLVELQSE
jgi:methylmalonyl-CoA/ethylmalonyl-CoA epimerase